MYKVFNQKLAGFLMINGNKLVGLEVNPNITMYNVFLFEKTPKLSKDLDSYSQVKNQNQKENSK